MPPADERVTDMDKAFLKALVEFSAEHGIGVYAELDPNTNNVWHETEIKGRVVLGRTLVSLPCDDEDALHTHTAKIEEKG